MSNVYNQYALILLGLRGPSKECKCLDWKVAVLLPTILHFIILETTTTVLQERVLQERGRTKYIPYGFLHNIITRRILYFISVS